jgi:hypothetical protein
MINAGIGPSITPNTLNSAAKGGQQNPPYLQMKTPVKAAPTQAQTAPVITPAASAPGDTVRRAQAVPEAPSVPTGQAPTPAMPSIPPTPTAGPAITPAGAPPQAGGNTLDDVYNFFKSDLQNQTKQAKANSISDASARGVYYGTPLTGSEADIDTQYLRGLGQLQSGMYGNAQSDALARLGLASNLGYQGLMQQPATSAPMNWAALGNLFGSSPSNPTTDKRNGPVITPPKTGQNNQSDAAHNLMESFLG